MNLNLILQDYNVPTVSEDLKYTLEGQLSYSEQLLFCLKRLQIILVRALMDLLMNF